ncbi:unnamed protein product [Gadus morhua 'NCC']
MITIKLPRRGGIILRPGRDDPAQTEGGVDRLRWLAARWLWMDRTAGGRYYPAECPANGNQCGTLSGGGQQARSCVEKRRFFCLKQAN